MRKVLTAIYLGLTAVLVLSLSGCGGGSSSSFVSNNDVPAVVEVASLESPAFQIGNSYRILRGASLTGMGGAMYYVSNTGNEAKKATLNLGFSEALGTQSLVFIDDDTGKAVFAYDPSGSRTNYKASGTVSYSGGTQLKYTSLSIPQGFFSSLNVDTASTKTIYLNGDSATIGGQAVPSYDYVWHADPDHRDEYYTEGLEGTEILSEDYVTSAMTATDGVFIARDVRYLTNSLDFTGTVANDEEQEYAAYYSESVRAVVSDELGGTLTGPYIFATLPMSGMGGQPGTPPGGGGDFGGGTPLGVPGSGDFGGGTPPGGNPLETPVISAISRNRVPYGVLPAVATSNSDITAFSTMTHSAEEAYSNPVLHITEPGVYTLTGTWNGQIWIEVGEESTDKVAVILDSVDVTCTVAPALVFKEVYECGPDDSSEVASRMAADSGDVGKSVMEDAGAIVLIADDSVNNFTGANVYRMLKPQAKKSSVTTIDGTDVSQQKKRYKMDGAFYSFMSMVVGGGEKANGVLNVTSTTYEGLGAELHMTFESGVLSVSAQDDGMNFNEDDTSVFTMLGGELTVTATGGDGIDSNGYIAILGGSLDITAAQDSNELNAGAEGPLDADCGVYMADGVTYTHRAYSGTGGEITPPSSGDITPPSSGDITPPEDSGDVTPPSSGDVTPPAQSEDITPQPSDEPSEDEPDVTPTPTPAPQPGDNPSGDEPDITPSPASGDLPDITPTPSSGDIPDITPSPSSGDNSGSVPNVPGNIVQPDTPQNDPNSYIIPNTPTTWDTDTVTIESSSGTTTISIGGTTKLKTDPQASTPRTVSTSSNVFKLERQVNDFSGIVADN
ncbi:MAG: carbohydrate-binding domain-containing protein [Synergistaceae bacterium]|nr:carbohydrate-binding domain-containing protein [Synergistaceae bacterium]